LFKKKKKKKKEENMSRTCVEFKRSNPAAGPFRWRGPPGVSRNKDFWVM